MRTTSGTAGFKDPEMFRDIPIVKKAVDVYALGVIFYMLLILKPIEQLRG